MGKNNEIVSRRAFFKTSLYGSGGLLLSFGFTSQAVAAVLRSDISEESSFQLNGHIIINEDNSIVIFSQNPEIGQNVKTSMPMIIAEELDADWSKVTVEQANLDTDKFKRQVAGGSQSIRKSWNTLRNVGGTARHLLLMAAAEYWGVSVNTLKTADSFIENAAGKKLPYGFFAASAVGLKIPKKIALKDPTEFKLIGKGILNVDAKKIVSGKPMYGLDTKVPGMLYARMIRPPGFGMELLSFDSAKALKKEGVLEVFSLENKIVVIAKSTWEAIQGAAEITTQWTPAKEEEDSKVIHENLRALVTEKPDNYRVNIGDVAKAFEEADTVIERFYQAPFLPHNCMEPMNFFANVTDASVELHGPIQTPEMQRKAVARLLGREESEITVGMSRMGGGFGRRLTGDFILEAAAIANHIRKPVLLFYTREDDMTAGVYRPASTYRVKAAIAGGEFTAYEMIGAGVGMRNTVRPNTWPQGAVPNFRLASNTLQSNITIGFWRAPVSNFLAYAEQVFTDELVEKLGKDPIEFRIDSLKKAQQKKMGKKNYSPQRFVRVLEELREKSAWNVEKKGVFKGMSAYYSHNTYVAEVAEVQVVDGAIKIEKVTVVSDCGIVVNKSGAENQAVGGVIDGLAHAMYGKITFDKGVPQVSNFGAYKTLRNSEAPQVKAYFIKSDSNPTGMGEPTLPPAAAALANAIYKATGKRLYKQPFVDEGINFTN